VPLTIAQDDIEVICMLQDENKNFTKQVLLKLPSDPLAQTGKEIKRHLSKLL
jgi:hypothetical protein